MKERQQKQQEECRNWRVTQIRSFFFGLWQTEADVDSALGEIKSETERKEALKAQLNFRKNVLKQIPPKLGYEDVFLFSKKKQTFSVEKLKENVKKLVRHAFTIQPETSTEVIPILTGKTVKHLFLENGEENWFTGKVISQVPGYPEWYNIIYSEDRAVYSYQLVNDYKEGGLRITIA